MENGRIWVIDVASGAATKLAPHTAAFLDELPSWFPDGNRIAFQSDRSGRWEVWIMNADGTGARRLEPSRRPRTVWACSPAQADGRMVRWPCHWPAFASDGTGVGRPLTDAPQS